MRCGAGIGVALVLALAGCKGAGKRVSAWAEQQEAERERETAADRAEAEVLAKRPIRRPTGPGIPAGTYRLVDVRVEAEPFKRRTEPWDDPPADAPDLELRVLVDGSQVAECELGPDSLTGRCRLDVEVSIDPRTTVSLEVNDDDHLLPDVVGTASLAEPELWELGVELPMVQHGRVRSASITLRAIPTWWELYGWRVIGSGVGIAVGLLVLSVFRRSLLAPDPVTAATPFEPVAPGARCGACDEQVAAGATICPQCGATL